MRSRRNEKDSGGATNYEILSATMVDRQRKFCISNRLKRLKQLVNFCRKFVFIKKFFRVRSQNLQIIKIFGGLKFRFKILNVFNYKSLCSN